MNTSMRELMLAGAHFGHRVRFWNPRMAPYIYGKYHSTHIINLDHTVEGLSKATDFLKSIATKGGNILYLCTKPSTSEIIAEGAQSVSMPYINQRWLGGMLTNFKTTRASIDRLIQLEIDITGGTLKDMTKKEGIKLMSMKEKLEKTIGGVRDMTKLPDVLLVIDAGWHKGAIREAKKLGIPIVAIVDTNHSPDDIDYVIPGNDDSREATKIYINEFNLSITDGKKEWETNLKAEVAALGQSDTDEDSKRRVPSAPSTTSVALAKRQASTTDGNKTASTDIEIKKTKIITAKRPAPPKMRVDIGTVTTTTAEQPTEPADTTDRKIDDKVVITALMVKQLREETGFGMMECKRALVECSGDFEQARSWLRVKGDAKADKVAHRQASEGRIAFAQQGGVGVLVEIGCETDFVARDENIVAFADSVAVAVCATKSTDIATLSLADGQTVESGRCNLVMKLGENITVRRLALLDAGEGLVCAYIHAGGKIGALCTFEPASNRNESLGRDICMHVVAMRPRYLSKDDIPAAVWEQEQKISTAQAMESGKPEAIAEKIAAGKMEKYLTDVVLLEQAFVKDSDHSVKQVLNDAKVVISDFRLLAVGEDD